MTDLITTAQYYIGQRVRIGRDDFTFGGQIGVVTAVTDRHIVLEEVAHSDSPAVAIPLVKVTSIKPAGPKFRARIFFYPYEGCELSRKWTWCREVDEEIHDYVGGLPVCESWQDARDRAAAWLMTKYQQSGGPS